MVSNSWLGMVKESAAEAVERLSYPGSPLPQELRQPLRQSFQTAIALSEQLEATAHSTFETTTRFIGETLHPVAESPVVKTAAKVPGLDWISVILGKVNTEQAQADVDQLRATYPTETPAEIAQRVIDGTAFRAAQLGLAMNIVPPVALALFAVDIVSTTKLQAEMLYRIAAAYGLSLEDPARKGEVMALYGTAFGTRTPLKVGLNVVEVIPVFGALVGASSNAVFLYLLGGAAREFYENKARKEQGTYVG